MKFLSINDNFPIPNYDIGNEPIKEMVLLAPFSKDKNGKILNDSPYFKVIESGSSYDFQAKIESYRDDVEIYSIIKRVISSGDNGLLNRVSGSYTDVYDIDCKSNLDLYNLSKSNVTKINNAIAQMSGSSEAAASTEHHEEASSEAAASTDTVVESEVKLNE